MENWISVKDRLPESNTQVICINPNKNYIYMAIHNNKMFERYIDVPSGGRVLTGYYYNVANWIPLPTI